MSEKNKDLEKVELKDQAMGVGAALVKGTFMATAAASGAVVGGVPGAIVGAGGGLAAELLSVIIPQFKQKRYDKFVDELEGRVESLEGEAKQRAEERKTSPEFADLFEDGARQAARALSDERIERIVNVLENSLTDEKIEHLQRKRILELFGQINDVELLLLQGQALYGGESQEFWDKHAHLIPEPAYMGAPQEVVDRSILHKSYREHLEELGLLQRTYRKPSSGKPVDFDFSTGQIKSSGYSITGIGRLLLHEVGMKEPMREQREMEDE